MKNVLMSWSGGKDSCLALFEIQKTRDYRVAALLTTVTRDYDRISMHGVRRVLLERQAASLGVPLNQVLITKGASNEEYETKLIEAVSAYRDQRIDSILLSTVILFSVKGSTTWVTPIIAFDPVRLVRSMVAALFH
jgi:diphthamide synthase (EF-2-diphthine--ammonia ligase)